MNTDGMEFDLDLTGIADRLRKLNPDLTNIKVEAPHQQGAVVRVIIETTKDELDSVGGRVSLRDPEIPEGTNIETVLRFLDHKPGKKMNVQVRRTSPRRQSS